MRLKADVVCLLVSGFAVHFATTVVFCAPLFFFFIYLNVDLTSLLCRTEQIKPQSTFEQIFYNYGIPVKR